MAEAGQDYDKENVRDGDRQFHEVSQGEAMGKTKQRAIWRKR
jgi:hypothetical protein